MTRAQPRPARAFSLTVPSLVLVLLLTTTVCSLAKDDGSPRILFVGNSFTLAHGSPAAEAYGVGTVRDLNGGKAGGVPAMFKTMAGELGLTYNVSVEAAFGRTLAWHWKYRQAAIVRPWDVAVLQEQSMLDPKDPGNSAGLMRDGKRIASALQDKNADVRLVLVSAWSRPDRVNNGRWSDGPFAAMAEDLQKAHEQARAAIGGETKIAPVGLAFNRAIAQGVAQGPPLDPSQPGRVKLWAPDNHHASVYGSYLTALVILRNVTGKDPRQLGPDDSVARDLHIDPGIAAALQKVAAQ